MANITLPSNPVNGQKVTVGTRLFEYSSTTQRWSSRVFQPLGDLSVSVTNQAPTINVSSSSISLDTAGANVLFTYQVADVDSSALKVSHTVNGITNSSYATVYHHKANNTVTIQAGTEEFSSANVVLTVTDGRNNASVSVNVSAQYSQELDIAGTFSVNSNTLSVGMNPDDIEFKSDGTKMWVVGDASSRPKQYTLSTAWDLSTASADNINNFSWGHGNQYVQGFAMSADGYTAVVLDEGSGGLCYQYDLSTAFDMDSASYNTTIGEKNFSLGFLGQTNSETGGARWYDSGNILALYGRSRSIFATIDCSANPYTLNGATKIESTMMRDYDAGSYGSAAGFWSSDGYKLYIMGGTFVDTSCKRISCSTAWRASTADTSNIDSFSLPSGGGTGSEGGMTHSPDYTKIFVGGSTVKRVDIS